MIDEMILLIPCKALFWINTKSNHRDVRAKLDHSCQKILSWKGDKFMGTKVSCTCFLSSSHKIFTLDSTKWVVVARGVDLVAWGNPTWIFPTQTLLILQLEKSYLARSHIQVRYHFSLSWIPIVLLNILQWSMFFTLTLRFLLEFTQSHYVTLLSN